MGKSKVNITSVFHISNMCLSWHFHYLRCHCPRVCRTWISLLEMLILFPSSQGVCCVVATRELVGCQHLIVHQYSFEWWSLWSKLQSSSKTLKTDSFKPSKWVTHTSAEYAPLQNIKYWIMPFYLAAYLLY